MTKKKPKKKHPKNKRQQYLCTKTCAATVFCCQASLSKISFWWIACGGKSWHYRYSPVLTLHPALLEMLGVKCFSHATFSWCVLVSVCGLLFPTIIFYASLRVWAITAEFCFYFNTDRFPINVVLEHNCITALFNIVEVFRKRGNRSDRKQCIKGVYGGD